MASLMKLSFVALFATVFALELPSFILTPTGIAFAIMWGLLTTASALAVSFRYRERKREKVVTAVTEARPSLIRRRRGLAAAN